MIRPLSSRTVRHAAGLGDELGQLCFAKSLLHHGTINRAQAGLCKLSHQPGQLLQLRYASQSFRSRPITRPSSVPAPSRARAVPIEPPPVIYGDPRKVATSAVEDAAKRRTRYVFVASLFVAWTSAYSFYVWKSYQKDLETYNARDDKLPQNADVSDRWKNEKRSFDLEVDSSEKVMLMKRKRRRLIAEAYGDVLEVSAGTGRNMDLYDTRPYDDLESASTGRSTQHRINSMTFNDQSEIMLTAAKKKWIKAQDNKANVNKFQGPVNWVVGDAGIPGLIKRPQGGYDTIVQSMGICSMADPVGFLQTLSRLARQPGEKKNVVGEDDGKGGKIFLLEHGRASSRWDWINGYLDNSAAMHADRYGCWYNKDIEKVIEESGLVVEKTKRSSFGTVWEIVLRPSPRLQPLIQPAAIEEPSKKSRSWWSWG